MKKGTEKLKSLTCRIPERILDWLDEMNPGNRTYVVRTILEEAYERHSAGDVGNTPTSQPHDNPRTSRKTAGSVRSQ